MFSQNRGNKNDPGFAIAARHTGSVSRDMLERFINQWDKPEASK
jgi:hypothetical protein